MPIAEATDNKTIKTPDKPSTILESTWKQKQMSDTIYIFQFTDLE